MALASTGQNDLRVFAATELAEATCGFSPACLIGEGGFGKVYRAMLSLAPIAIKVLDHQGLQGLREFENEMKLLAGLEHPHVVGLLGFTAESLGTGSDKTEGIQALVYELMARGSLDEHLHAGKETGIGLGWVTRVKVAAQTSCALAYLHGKGIIHRDVKPANVFLGADCNAKLGDIGLGVGMREGGQEQQGVHTGPTGGDASAPGQEAIGTWQYLAPEYRLQGRSSAQTDTYALGLTLLQLVTGAPGPKDLVYRAQAALEQATLDTQYLDPSAGEWDVRAGERLVKLALWCCMHNPAQRPSAATVASSCKALLVRVSKQQEL